MSVDMRLMKRAAIFDSTQRYRYLLAREWSEQSATRVQSVGFVMLNPSTATGQVDDPTIRRCIGFAQDWGYKKLYVGNLFALRATDPYELYKVPLAEAVGPDNDRYLTALFETCDRVIAAWGTHGALGGRHAQSVGMPYWHLGFTKDGYPRHPLYLKANTQPVAWE